MIRASFGVDTLKDNGQVSFVSATSSVSKFLQLHNHSVALSSTPVLFRIKVSRGEIDSLPSGSSPARSDDFKEGMPDKLRT